MTALDWRTLVRYVVSVVGLLLLTGVVATVLTTALTALGLPNPVASPAGLGGGIAAALAAADAFTPIGRGTRTDALERKSDVRLGFEIVLAVLLGAAGTVLVVSLGGGGLLSLFGGALLGYAAFMFQNREAYVLERE
ncbi:hypothetical protein [Halospeciosus flavus]|uniref:Uncharacterized protein n=1 Tax=Halospeciosus flavus TaxID=3032283 RepID=A0ABD5Z8N3_9EURY|nr:hypothetical protein [Halospeciosus flavus]